MAARELLRRPRSFVVPLAILCLLALLQLFPSAILDGITQDSTAAVRNAPADLVVYSRNANGVQLRSRIEPDVRQQIAAVPGVAQVATFDLTVLSGKPADAPVAVPLAVMASDQGLAAPTAGGPAAVPGPGQAVADESLRTWSGFTEGTELHLGPLKTPVTIVAFAPGTNLWFAGGLIVNKATWLTALGGKDIDPGRAAAGPAQALLVSTADGASVTEVQQAIDTATGGAATALTRQQAVAAMPGNAEQEAIFGYVRLVTLAVALVVVALFLSFVTLERGPLYAVLKAIGASSRQIFGALIVQILLITFTAVLGATLITFALTRIPNKLPPVMQAGRVTETLVSLAITAVLGTALSFRRVVRVDPAAAIG